VVMRLRHQLGNASEHRQECLCHIQQRLRQAYQYRSQKSRIDVAQTLLSVLQV